MRKKIIYYDVTRLVHRSVDDTPTGIDRVDINYAYFFLESNEYELIPVFQNESIFFLIKNKEFILHLYKKWIYSKKSNFDFEKLKIDFLKKNRKTVTSIKDLKNSVAPKSLDADLFDTLYKNRSHCCFYINTSHHGVGNYLAYQDFITIGNAEIIFFLHDTIPIDYPEYVREGDDITHAKRVTAIASVASRVLVNSEYTQRSFIKFCKSNNLRTPPTSVIHIGVEEKFLNLSETSNNSEGYSNYFVYVSTIEPRKNHLTLLLLWRDLIEKRQKEIPKLILIGKRGWNNQNVFDLLDRCPKLKDYVVELNGLSDNRLHEIVRGANALLYPSFVEGWGMPIIEAIAMGVPAICSDIPPHRECSQNAMKYLSPYDLEAWKKTILDLAANKELREEFQKKCQSVEIPRWNDHFEQLKECLVCNHNSSMGPLIRNVSEKADSLEISKTSFSEKSISNYCKLASRTNLTCQNSRKNSVFESLVIKLIFKNSPRRKQLLKKFKRNPVGYLRDSKISVLKKIGEKLDEY